MILVTNGSEMARALASPIDKRIRRLLRRRRGQLGDDLTGHVHFAVVQLGDTPADVEAMVGLPIFGTAEYRPDWVQDHGSAFELVFDLTEDFTQVVLIP